MTKAYHETLTKDYFGDLYDRVTQKITRGENVLISAIPGFGVKTVFNFLEYNIRSDALFEEILIYDPEIQAVPLVDFVKQSLNTTPAKSQLILVRFFESSKDKAATLERLDSLRRRNPKDMVFLIFADHTVLTHPDDYQAKSTIFFSEIIYMFPFSETQTKKMIASLYTFYGWKIDKSLYTKIYKLSGGVPRLIKYLCKEIYESKVPIENSEKFQIIPQINFQLKLLTKLLITLPEEELETLRITEDGKIKSRLVKGYFKIYQNEAVAQLLSNLTQQEQKLMTYLIENQNEVVSLDKIADLIALADDDFSLWAIYKLISRLKIKVKNNFEIRNLKGKGYKLEKLNL